MEAAENSGTGDKWLSLSNAAVVVGSGIIVLHFSSEQQTILQLSNL